MAQNVLTVASQLNYEGAVTEQYDRYYRSGAYDARYPCANPSTLCAIQSFMTSASKVLDFGCGSGRYAIPLASNCRSIVAYDPSHEAISRLREHLGKKCPCPRTLEEARTRDQVSRAGPYDVAIAMFGVLSHIPSRQGRGEALKFLRDSLSRGGVLVLSVPNRMRRFYRQQLCMALLQGDCSGQVYYRRDEIGQEMPYFLYTARSLAHEIEESGFSLISLRHESILSERIVTRFRYISDFERLCFSWLPAGIGYGLLAIARRT